MLQRSTIVTAYMRYMHACACLCHRKLIILPHRTDDATYDRQTDCSAIPRYLPRGRYKEEFHEANLVCTRLSEKASIRLFSSDRNLASTSRLSSPAAPLMAFDRAYGRLFSPLLSDCMFVVRVICGKEGGLGTPGVSLSARGKPTPNLQLISPARKVGKNGNQRA